VNYFLSFLPHLSILQTTLTLFESPFFLSGNASCLPVVTNFPCVNQYSIVNFVFWIFLFYSKSGQKIVTSTFSTFLSVLFGSVCARLTCSQEVFCFPDYTKEKVLIHKRISMFNYWITTPFEKSYHTRFYSIFSLLSSFWEKMMENFNNWR